MIFESNDPNIALAALEMSMRIDDFSVQFAHKNDVHFWLRFEDFNTPDVVISDFFFGELSDGELALILESAVRSLDNSATEKLIFFDIEPGRITDTRMENLRISTIVDQAAALNAQLVTAISEKIERGKRNLVFKLS
ncbi:hypothetical protein [Tateyamaria sp. SN3-11]|uniref:hypothetical protein n=1 Tax=Tateyamaria sp. SN3-11 TaxID=3092147 RepID=UPI0039E8FDBB